MKAETNFSLKDQLFNAEKVEYLARLFKEAQPDFPARAFCRTVVDEFPNLELKQRIEWISRCLQDHLPTDFPKAVGIILKALPPELDPDEKDDDFGDFIIAPLSHFVATNGCSEEHLELSLEALKAITKRFTVEDAIRYFINEFPDRTFEFLTECALDPSYHVRRLASEGTRPSLPWSQKLRTDPVRALTILDRLYTDQTRYVTRSVANHLNDISKLDANLVLDTLRRWEERGDQSTQEMRYIVNHALRTLVKQANPGALNLLGFTSDPEIKLVDFSSTTPKVKLGTAFEFSLVLQSKKNQKLLLDYVVEFPSPQARATPRRKVFKLKTSELKVGQRLELQKKHPMRLMTTRALHQGIHRVDLRLNGVPCGSLEFELTV